MPIVSKGLGLMPWLVRSLLLLAAVPLSTSREIPGWLAPDPPAHHRGLSSGQRTLVTTLGLVGEAVEAWAELSRSSSEHACSAPRLSENTKGGAEAPPVSRNCSVRRTSA